MNDNRVRLIAVEPVPDGKSIYPEPVVEGWKVQTVEVYPMSRVVTLRPVEQILVEFKTSETRQGRYHEHVYDAEVRLAYVHHSWDYRTNEWTSHGNLRVALLKPDGTEYTSGWRTELITMQPSLRSEPGVEETLIPLFKATLPRTRITITEEPA